jgi:hypothetical protein
VRIEAAVGALVRGRGFGRSRWDVLLHLNGLLAPRSTSTTKPQYLLQQQDLNRQQVMDYGFLLAG